MTVYIQKDQFGLKYKTQENSLGWKPFPNSVTDAASISKFFEQGGHQPTGGKYDPPKLDFRDAKFKQVVYYTVDKNRGLATANFNPATKVNIDVRDPATELEIHDFLRPRCAYDLEKEVLNLDTLAEKNALLMSKASSAALSELNTTIKTNEAINLYLSNHAKQYHDARAVVNFSE